MNLINHTKKTILKFGFLTLLLVVYSCSNNETQIVITMNNLVWEDNFEVDGAPDTNNWTYEIGDGTAQGIPGWGNNEFQYYTSRPENVKVENGNLVITARKETFSGSGYTSARLLTKGLFQQKYGRFEARIKLPWGQGLWPAFWMLGSNIDENGGDTSWPTTGEIDILELWGSVDASLVEANVHYADAKGKHTQMGAKGYHLPKRSFSDSFHEFEVETLWQFYMLMEQCGADLPSI